MAYWIDSNKLMDSLKAGKTVFGLQVRSRSPLVVEMAGYMGFDFVYIDQEHFACDDETAETLFRAADASGTTPIIRIRDNDPESIMHVLDMGAKGVIMPHVDTPEEARRFVEGGKFPPLGKRGSSAGCRAASYGYCPSAYYYARANERTALMAMIESEEGVRNIEAILDTGVDAIRVGRGDLSLSMGLHGHQDDPRFIATIRTVTDACRKRGIPVGTSATDVESAKYYRDLGFNMFTYVSDLDYLVRKIPSELAAVREALERS